MKQSVILSILLALFTVGVVQAEDGTDELGVTFDLTYMSKWMSKGVEAYGSHGAFFKTIDLDFYGTGFGAKVTHRNATSSGHVDSQRFDYRPYYYGTLFEGEKHQTDFNLSVGYEHYPGLARNRSNTTWEWIFAFKWKNLLPGNFVPSYVAHYEYAAGENYTKTPSGTDMPSGWVHRFILGYDMETESLPSPIHLSSEVAYVDGLGGLEHDWGYLTLGASTKFNITENMSFVPGIYHQISMEDSVSTKDDITYCKLSMKYKF
jgi:hypothetical protein